MWFSAMHRELICDDSERHEPQCRQQEPPIKIAHISHTTTDYGDIDTKNRNQRNHSSQVGKIVAEHGENAVRSILFKPAQWNGKYLAGHLGAQGENRILTQFHQKDL